MPAVTIQASRRLRHRGDRKTPFCLLGGFWGTFSCTGNRRGGGVSKNDEPRHQESPGPGSLGGICLLPGRPLILPQHPSTTSGTVGEAIPQAPVRPVGKIQGRPAMHWLEPVGGGWSVKIHCLRRWRETSEPSRAGRAAKEGESGAREQGRWWRIRTIL